MGETSSSDGSGTSLVDALSEVPEYDASGSLEADNALAQTISVGPDLIVRNVGLADEPVPLAPAALQPPVAVAVPEDDEVVVSPRALLDSRLVLSRVAARQVA